MIPLIQWTFVSGILNAGLSTPIYNSAKVFERRNYMSTNT
jgi:hypothetical protein